MHPAPKVELQIAQECDRDCIEMLMQFYHYDASEWISLDVTDGGRFSFRSIDRFWHAAGQFPFVIRVDGVVAGLAVVDKDVTNADSDFNVGYLFVLRKYRGKGIGRTTAHMMFAKFQGGWEVYQVEQNLEAIDFWRRVIGEYTRGNFEERAILIDERRCLQQRFCS